MMTIAVAEGILENPENPISCIGNRFMEWYYCNPKDIGNIIETALEEYDKNKDWTRTAVVAHKYNGGRSAGNESLMRCIPVALFYKDINKIIEVTEQQSRMTHFDEKATRACILYNKLEYRYLNNEFKIPAIREVLRESPEYNIVFHMLKEELNPTGYVVDTLISALWVY